MIHVESAYGINVSGALAAYQFKLNRPDTLRAVQIYFPQMLDTVNQIDFKLTVWDDNNGIPGNVLYQKIEYPKHTNTNNFHFYYIDSLFQLTDIFYVGWEQNSNDMINIGLDKNNSANSYMFYNVGGSWNNSQYNGSWMIRPIVSMNTISLDLDINEISFDLFPNPAIDKIKIKSPSQNNRIRLFDVSGNLLFSKKFYSDSFSLNISSLSSGIYIIRLENDLGLKNKKLIIR